MLSSNKCLFVISCCTLFFAYNSSVASPIDNHTTHSLELKPASLPLDSFIIAATTFLPDWDDHLSVFSSPSHLDFSDIAQQNRIFNLCISKGFNRTSCPEGEIPQELCPESNAYFKSCLSPQQQCINNDFLNSCQDGFIPDINNPCPFDASFAKCIPNPCDGYEFNLDEASAPGYILSGNCLSGDTEKFQRLPAPCPGFSYDTSNCGNASQCQKLEGLSCLSGETLKYTECNPCPVPSCDLPQVNIETFYCNGALKCLIP